MEEELKIQLKEQIHALLDEGRVNDALPMIRQAAHWGDLKMQELACAMLLHGKYGVMINRPVGLEYARMAALNGSNQGMVDLAALLLEGNPVEKDEKAAIHFLQKAASDGYAPAMDRLGMMFMQGRGVHKSYKTAAEWFKKALDAGYDPGEQVLRHYRAALKHSK